MAIAGNAIYSGRTLTSYVSSNAYYGYVPLRRSERESNGATGRDLGFGPGFGPGLAVVETDSESMDCSRCSYNSPMETDDEECNCSSASLRLNNHCLIPEERPPPRHRSQAGGESPFHRQQQPVQVVQVLPDATAADALLRPKNRKRCNRDMEHATQLKKFREGRSELVTFYNYSLCLSMEGQEQLCQDAEILWKLVLKSLEKRGGGNGRVYYGTGSAKDNGETAVHGEAASSLRLNSTADTISDLFLKTSERCCWAAGNSSFISNADTANLFSIDDSKPSDNTSMEYETILFETHGCSVYHHYRLQLLEDDCIEAEF